MEEAATEIVEVSNELVAIQEHCIPVGIEIRPVVRKLVTQGRFKGRGIGRDPAPVMVLLPLAAEQLAPFHDGNVEEIAVSGLPVRGARDRDRTAMTSRVIG